MQYQTIKCSDVSHYRLESPECTMGDMDFGSRIAIDSLLLVSKSSVLFGNGLGSKARLTLSDPSQDTKQ